ncbi:zf-DNL-domain-containing protein [Moesziomyces antarcticus]|uniref:Related to ZIM17 - Zinc finger Motif protein, mitochondrial n=1 Tax=Pseudozyma antarctica TaxID=84753 RepID=A0A5C3FHM3_PSEA2|nr:zf-DNL-domain-containing protein [Moesziomyces antarcticus]GAK62655.1 zf-DNL-domain-containing protein [Moesziomyces antarcticus]SPO43217.1 related to ZIM17 - Zinc finger Motif protein, mitochondrial [Moesziomyces antarcticus]
MSLRTPITQLARCVASSSRQTLPRQVAIASPLRSQLLPSTRLSALPHRSFGCSASLRNDRSRIEAYIPETTLSDSAASSKSGDIDAADEANSIPVTGERTPIGQIEQRLAITFTCTVDECGHRSSHEFSKRSYTKGIVIVQCPGCKNRHLIADNLSWFTETEDEPRTIEQMIEAKGGKVRRGTVGVDGETGETIEILS